MLNRPRSSLPTTRRIKASRFSARSSGGMSRVPIAAWNVRLSRLRTRTVFRNELIRFVGSAVGGTGRGILPRGPRTTPRRLPITGMSGASAMKKSYDVARVLAFRLSLAYSSISCGWITRSAAFRAFKASSPDAKTQTRIGFPRPLGRTTSSSTRFFGTGRSMSRRFTATSTDYLNARRLAASTSFLIVSTECLSAQGDRLLQCVQPRWPSPERGRDSPAHQPAPRRAVSGILSDFAVPADERLDRGFAGAPEPIPGPRASNRRGGSASVERRRSRRRGRNGRRVEGERPFEGTGDRDGPLDLQRDGVDRSQAPRGGPL